jgi:hypothetical protein
MPHPIRLITRGKIVAHEWRPLSRVQKKIRVKPLKTPLLLRKQAVKTGGDAPENRRRAP